MTRRRVVIGGVLGVLAIAAAATAVYVRIVLPQRDRAAVGRLRAEIAALEQERQVLIARRTQAAADDERLKNLPSTPIKVGVPTSLATALIAKALTGFANHVTLELSGIRTAASGTITRVVTLGTYDLRISVDRVTGRLTPGTPRVQFGGDAIVIALPVSVTSGRGDATIRFRWDGRNVAGVVCGDMDVTRQVSGTVEPDTYHVSGRLALRATATQLVLHPLIPPVKIRLRIKPSEQSWADARKILDDKTGVCGFVLDRVDVMGAVQKVVDRGFTVTLPLNRIKPVSLPVGVSPELTVRGRQVGLQVKLGSLSITERMMWLGIDVGVGLRSPLTTSAGSPGQPAGRKE